VKKNNAFTLVELIIVLACLSGVTIFFWTILDSSSKDSYTLTDKMMVQTSVTSLMNVLQQDIQEARIKIDGENKVIFLYEDDEYVMSDVTYVFDKSNRTVTRKKGTENAVYDNIGYFSMKNISGKNFGAEVRIIGGKEIVVTVSGESLTETFDKTRYELNSSYYTRNTM